MPEPEQCDIKPTFKDVEENLPETLKAMGFEEKCTKEAESAFAGGSTSGSFNAPFTSGGVQASFQASANRMKESGCGQFVANIQNVSTSLANINCTLQRNQSTATVSQTANSRIRIRVEELSQEQIDLNLKVLAGQQANLKKILEIMDKNPQPMFQDMFKVLSAEIAQAIKQPTLSIKGSTLENNSSQTLVSEVKMTSAQETFIEEEIKTVTQQSAEQKMRQELGVNALTNSAKQLIRNKIKTNTLLSKENIQETIKSVSLKQGANNTIEIINKGGGDLIIEGTTISNNIVQDLVNKAILANGNRAASQVVTEVLTEQASKQLSEGKSAGQDDLARELGDANAKAIDLNKAESKGSMGAVIALGLVVLLVLGGGGLIIKNVKGMFTKYIFLIVALIGIIVGVVGKGKDPDNVLMIVIGSILLVSGSGLGIYSLVKKKKKLPGGLRRYYY